MYWRITNFPHSLMCIIISQLHCVKNVQIRSVFWSVFDCLRTRKNSVFGHFSRNVDLRKKHQSTSIPLTSPTHRRQTFQRRFNVVFRLIWRWDVLQRQINVDTGQLWNLQRWTTSNQRCLFQCRLSQRWATSKQRCEYDNLKKIKIEPRVKNRIIFLKFKEYTGPKIFFVVFSILRGICKRVFAEPQKFLKHQIFWIIKTICKPSHFVKCQLVFNFTRRHFQVHYDYRCFDFIYIF